MTTGVKPCSTTTAHRVVDERELEQRGLAHDVREPRAARLRAARRVDEARCASANAAWSSAGASVLVADRLDRDAVVFAAVGHRRVGRVRHLQRQLAQLARRPRAAPAPCAASSSFSVGRGFDLRLRARRARPCRSPSTPRSAAPAAPRPRSRAHAVRLVGREHLVDQAGAHALALDAAPVLRLVAQPFEIDHASSSRICARNPSTHADAFFHALPTALPALDPGLDRTADGIRAEELHLAVLGARGCAARRRPPRRRRDPRSR